ncbi:MAG TPA: alanine--tRNA ligase [Clostridiales bacterium]|nr:alanine--tRNA ligase [Clostridiales bacterium]
MDSITLRKLYLDFFKDRGHAVIQGASLIPENDPTVLFTTAGMHPLVPYLSGEKHPQGTRLTDVQKCVRTGDIDEVGDATHCTFFEMLGNWSLGDYFKKEAISWSYEFLTSVLKIDKNRLAVSVFAGDETAPRDEEAAAIWQSCGIPADRIFFLPKKNNWWGPAGQTGPCGTDTEMFIDTGKPKCSEECSPACDCGKYIEIWNDVFMQYNKQADGSFAPLKQKNVDTGMGLERTLCILNGYKSVYETDLFQKAIAKLEELSGKKYGESEEVTKAMRIIADHIRTSTMLLGDQKGVTPSNVDQGYVLRRLIRRAVRFGRVIDLKEGALSEIAKVYIEQYKDIYPEIGDNAEKIVTELEKEVARFSSVLQQGLKEFEKVISYLPVKRLSGKTAFKLYDTYGFPIEMTVELAKEIGYEVDVEGYRKAFEEHQQKSHAGAEQRFKGGLQDNTVEVTRLHTATHLMNAALRTLVDENIRQKGSNITAERLRFDFNLDRPLTEEEIKKIEKYVNDAIAAKADVICTEMTVAEAKAMGAIGVFDSKYGEKVKVYQIGNFSTEICGGPHAKNTGELGKFRIVKEQSSSAGVRRIKAVLE